ncbi:MAG: class I SAM-dependent methyltransferase, partial [Chloroflexota bacterium]|nr:class I SAM-dependent methyltransferase [Chloroflexota bacterium]
MDLSAWEKKTVTLHWAGTKLSLHVAQELFSSHDIDQGTKLLLRSLDVDAIPPDSVVLDFGCGYGPLGLALQARLPSARVVLIDRDALAVKFAAWNAREIAVAQGISEVTVHGGLDLGSPHAPDGYDLILWNVPGKAGEAVLRGLIADVPHALRPDGLLALVVVNPLAAMLRDAIAGHQDLAVTHEARHTAHTVLHVQRGGEGRREWPRPTAFARGVFDRPPETLAQPELPYRLRPVIGLPEFDSPDFASAAIMEMLEASAASGRGVDLLLMEGL